MGHTPMGVARTAVGMGGGVYSPDVYYGAMPPLHGMAANPYHGYGYHVPMYGPYPDAPVGYDPAATMYDLNPGGFAQPPPPSAVYSNMLTFPEFHFIFCLFVFDVFFFFGIILHEILLCSLI